LGVVAAAIPVGLFFKLHDLPWNDPIQLVVVFGIVGLVFSYIVIQRLVNVTELEIMPQRILISRRPIPW
jgi:RsiW-degrading membrane proteinase PrsW (M82 family)